MNDHPPVAQDGDAGNPYAPPSPVNAPSPTGLDRTSAGSELEVGPRRRFTGGWILRRALASVCIVVPVMGLGITVGFVVAAVFNYVAAVSAIVGVLLLVSAVAWPLMNNDPPADRIARPLADGRAGFAVEIGFRPRLPGRLLDHGEPADDIGWLHFEPARLVYRGDRCTLTLLRCDIAIDLVEGNFVAGKLPFLHAYGVHVAELQLIEPLHERDHLWIAYRERSFTRTRLRRAQALRRAVREWMDETSVGEDGGS